MSEEKKGRMKVTIEVEVNEELMDLMKDAISKMHLKMPEMWKRKEEEKQQAKNAFEYSLFVSQFLTFLRMRVEHVCSVLIVFLQSQLSKVLSPVLRVGVAVCIVIM